MSNARKPEGTPVFATHVNSAGKTSTFRVIPGDIHLNSLGVHVLSTYDVDRDEGISLDLARCSFEPAGQWENDVFVQTGRERVKRKKPREHPIGKSDEETMPVEEEIPPQRTATSEAPAATDDAKRAKSPLTMRLTGGKTG